MKKNDFKIHLASLFTIILPVFLCALNVQASSGDAPYIAVGEAKARKSILALPPIEASNDRARSMNLGNEILNTLINDLSWMDLFRFLPTSAYPSGEDAQKTSGWKTAGAEYLIRGNVSADSKTLTLEAEIFDTNKAERVFTKRYTSDLQNRLTLARTFGDDIVQTLTGGRGIFRTKIAMSCLNDKKKKEIYIMDFDGKNIRQITHHQSITIAPAWSPDATKLAYSVYTKTKGVTNLDLWEYNFATNRSRVLSNRQGMNLGPSYSPDGSEIAVSMSFQGQPEIFRLNLRDLSVIRQTRHLGFDVEPSWSPDGSKLLFSSTRAGNPMLYIKEKGGAPNSAKRLTFAGRYNSSPSWSPTNNKIAFAGWKDGNFDIFMMNPDGTRIERLTASAGNNEDPAFSPDGNFIAFASDRTGSKQIYIMNVDGSFVRRMTYNFPECASVAWSG
jgi:TolB protein